MNLTTNADFCCFSQFWIKNHTKFKKQIFTKRIIRIASFYISDYKFPPKEGTIYFHPTKGTHWVAHMKVKYFDSYGCPLFELFLKSEIVFEKWEMRFFHEEESHGTVFLLLFFVYGFSHPKRKFKIGFISAEL